MLRLEHFTVHKPNLSPNECVTQAQVIVKELSQPEVNGLLVGDHVIAGGYEWAVTKKETFDSSSWLLTLTFLRESVVRAPREMTDWELFVEIARRLGANTSMSPLDPHVPGAVWLQGPRITFDFNEQRAYSTRGDGRKSWLDNNLLQWIDVLLDKPLEGRRYF